MSYAHGQLKVIYPHLKDDPKWLLLGGPDDSNEAQTARAKWPDIKIIGVEPDSRAVKCQRDNDWPEDCPLITAALSDRVGEAPLSLRYNDIKHATINKQLLAEWSNPPTLVTETVTLDALDIQYGPFEEAVLWLDIEGGEYLALLGAQELLKRGAIRLINVEMQCSLTELMEGIPRLMEQYGFSLADEHHTSNHYVERIYLYDTR